jgi:hypothetical protein
VDALHDHRQLERRQPDVEAEVGQVPPAARGVLAEHLRLARVAGRLRRQPSAPELTQPLVDQQQADVGQRVRDRGHLPVDHGGDLIVHPDQHVVQPVVTVHDRGRPVGGLAGGQPVVQLVDPGELPAARGVQLLLPPPDLPGQEPLRPPERLQPHRPVVDGMQVSERADQALGDGPGAVRTRSRHLLGSPVGDAVHPRHHVERRAQHAGVLAQRIRRGHWHAGVAQRADHLELAPHVVRRGQHVPQRRAAHHPGAGAVPDLVRQVRLAPGEQLRRQCPRQWATHLAGARLLEPAGEPLQVKPRNFAHQGPPPDSEFPTRRQSVSRRRRGPASAR